MAIKQVTSGHFQPTLRVDGSDNYASDGVVYAPVDSATVIKIGDEIYLDTDDAKPASDLADGGSEAINQELFHDKFLGIALRPSRAGETDPIPIATKGLFEADCDSATFEIGDLIGAAEASSGTELEDQKVKAVPVPSRAIGRCARRGTSTTRVLVEITSVVMYGGPQFMAQP